MDSLLVSKVLSTIERNPSPSEATPYFNADLDAVTGYRWMWGTRSDFVIVSVTIQPEQRRKVNDKIVLSVALGDVRIGGTDGGSEIGRGGHHQLSFTTQSKPFSPIDGLTAMLRTAVDIP